MQLVTQRLERASPGRMAEPTQLAGPGRRLRARASAAAAAPAAGKRPGGQARATGTICIQRERL